MNFKVVFSRRLFINFLSRPFIFEAFRLLILQCKLLFFKAQDFYYTQAHLLIFKQTLLLMLVFISKQFKAFYDFKAAFYLQSRPFIFKSGLLSSKHSSLLFQVEAHFEFPSVQFHFRARFLLFQSIQAFCSTLVFVTQALISELFKFFFISK